MLLFWLLFFTLQLMHVNNAFNTCKDICWNLFNVNNKCMSFKLVIMGFCVNTFHPFPSTRPLQGYPSVHRSPGQQRDRQTFTLTFSPVFESPVNPGSARLWTVGGIPRTRTENMQTPHFNHVTVQPADIVDERNQYSLLPNTILQKVHLFKICLILVKNLNVECFRVRGWYQLPV